MLRHAAPFEPVLRAYLACALRTRHKTTPAKTKEVDAHTGEGACKPSIQSLLRHGTQEQKDTFLSLIHKGKLAFCLGYSEPEAGSDLASLRTRAVRGGDHWVINGQKLWPTGGHGSDWVWLAVRTGPEAQPRHAGISVFLIPMDTPGFTVQQHRALSGEISCTVFYDNVRVPDTTRVGEVNGGWKVIVDALAGGRITMGNNRHRTAPPARRPPGQATRALVASAIRSTSRSAAATAQLAAPMASVMGGELAERFGEAVLDILGPEAALSASVPGVPGGGSFEYGLRQSVMFVVGGGTNDIQRGWIARGLGLPR
ncbi:acyl-CoA dehydrogenase family protein [Streptomyces sp. enrichment culture]|uniref:acyl-CoA dehydrogenase family protein n=1 Tax=Streptomyces sp. enrichment culture TaxID=1795815 RepID=UPI003F55A704